MAHSVFNQIREERSVSESGGGRRAGAMFTVLAIDPICLRPWVMFRGLFY